MKTQLDTFVIRSSRKQEMIDITPDVTEFVRDAGIRNGFISLKFLIRPMFDQGR